MRKIKVTAAAFILAASTLLGVSACDAGPPCISGHYEYELMPVYSGKTTTFMLEPVWYCDVYAPQSSK